MKAIIVISLYLLGVFIDALWMISAGAADYGKDKFSESPALSSVSESTIRTIVLAIILIASLFWPIDVIIIPFKCIKRVL